MDQKEMGVLTKRSYTAILRHARQHARRARPPHAGPTALHAARISNRLPCPCRHGAGETLLRDDGRRRNRDCASLLRLQRAFYVTATFPFNGSGEFCTFKWVQKLKFLFQMLKDILSFLEEKLQENTLPN